MVSFKALLATCMMALAVSMTLSAVVPDTPYFNERGVLQIGTNEQMDVVVNSGSRHEQQISYAHASYIAVHFNDFSLDNGGVVIVRSPDSSVGYVYTGRGRNNAGDFISSLIPGDTAVVEYFPNASANQSNQAFRISGFSRGFPNAQSESICGVDDSVPAKCYTNGTAAAAALPLAYERSQSVARLYMRGVGLCTGWLVGSEGHLLTNQHCVEDASIAGAIDVEFGAESASCAEECQVRLGCGGKIVATTTLFITNDEAFDYALLKLPAGTDVSQYKYLQLRTSGASVGEQIYIGIGDVFRCWVWPDGDVGRRFFEISEEGVISAMVSGRRWVIVVSIIIRKIIAILAKPLEWTGNVVEFILNLLSMNGNLSGLLCNIVRGEVVVPRRGTETFISTVGLLDGRMDLLNGEKMLNGTTDFVSEERGFGLEMGNRNLVDLCVMASKLSYENEKVIQNIVLRHWKMHFVGFYNCWNDFQKDSSTQVFILCDKAKEANLILISFRGTEPFDADDWNTDFDYSWYEIPEVGKIHIGFLEALGLGNRNDANSFKGHLQAETSISSIASDVPHDGTSPFGLTRSTISNLDQNIEKDRLLPPLESEQFDAVTPEVVQLTAYHAVKLKLRKLLMDHKNAKFVVTGHSLGGALAVLFPTVLVLHKEMEIMGRLLGVYTFGQPRVGNKQLGEFMEPHLVNPIPRYFRVVYCNDIVPRLPYDDKAFFFKHFGVCLYYDSLFTERKVDEEPNKNFFGIRYLIPEYLNALWELIRSLLMGYTHGPEYREGWFCTLVRVMGLALPGISAHCLTNYIDSVRLGKKSQSL